MKLSDQIIKQRIVLLTAGLGLVGFFLEVGPLGAFSLANNTLPVFSALWLEIRALGFIAYLALAASAYVGLHMGEKEPTPKQQEENAEIRPRGEGEAVGERVRVRPELHQMRMFFTALVGYTLFKGLSIVLMNLDGAVPAEVLAHAFQFGLIYIGLGWFVLWQFLRWFAMQKKWVRLQDELVGGNVLPIIAAFYVIFPLVNLITAAVRGELAVGGTGIMEILLNLAVLAAGIILWRARPYRLRRTVTALLIDGGVIVVLTIILGVIEQGLVGG